VPGAGGRVGPGRGARLSTSPFPRTALRTRRASHPGTELSTRPVTNKRLRCRSAPQYPALTTRSDAGIHRRLLPCRPAPQPRCAPSPCGRLSRTADYYGHSATTHHQQRTTRLPAISLAEAKYVYQQGAARLLLGTGQYGTVVLSEEAAAYFKRNRCRVELLPTPKVIPVWNQAEGAVIGLFHVTC
jgi:hypothetical protein